MKRNKGTVAYTPDDIALMLRRGEDRTDWDRVRRMSEDELEKAIADDPDEGPEGLAPIDWSTAFAGLPPRRTEVRIDTEVVDWFKSQGRNYQVRINAVLRSFMLAHRGGGKD